MTPSERIQATLCGSYILVLLMQHKELQSKGSVARLRQKLQSILRKQGKDLAKLADEAYNYVKEELKDRRIAIDTSVVSESLLFDFENQMKKLFGNNIVELVDRANQKLFVEDTGEFEKSDVVSDSYMVADMLKESIRKYTFDYMKDKQ